MRYTDEDIEFANLILTDRENLDDAKVVEWMKDSGHVMLLKEFATVYQQRMNIDFNRDKKEEFARLENTIQERKSRRMTLRWSVAASVILLVGLFVGRAVDEWRDLDEMRMLAKTERIVPGVKAELILSTGERVCLAQRSEFIEGMKECGIRNDSLAGLNYVGAKIQGEEMGEEIVYNTMQIPVGGFYQLKLADKSEIEDLVNGVLSPKETIWGLFSATFYTNVRANLYLTGSSSCLFLKSDHDDTYLADKEGMDYRYEKWFKNYSAIEASGMRCVKILDTYELTYSTRPDARVKGINMLRLPELYYIITEYYLSLENQDEAVKYFDKVLQSRGLTGYADRQGASLTLEKVIQERRKELICEGQYFFTQKRYNQSIYEPKSGKLYPASNDIYVFPLPENETEYRY